MDDQDYQIDDASGPVHTLDRTAPVWVAGHRGLVGSAIWRHLGEVGFTNLLGCTSGELNLEDRSAVFEFLGRARPQAIFLAAAYVGGIVANSTYPADFLSRNIQIQTNVMDAAAKFGVKRLLFFGSSCIYPKFAPQPIKESHLNTGKLESTNEAFAVAKLAGIAQVRAVRRQHGLPWVAAMPSNVYGPQDNFSDTQSHVLSALVRRFTEAAAANSESVTNWGTGSPRREFIYADDVASAALHLLDHYNDPSPVNIGTGVDHSIKELSDMIAEAVGFNGEIRWDTSKPDGTPRKLLDVSRLTAMGWRASTDIATGIRSTVDWFQRTGSDVRC